MKNVFLGNLLVSGLRADRDSSGYGHIFPGGSPGGAPWHQLAFRNENLKNLDTWNYNPFQSPFYGRPFHPSTYRFPPLHQPSSWGSVLLTADIYPCY